MKKLLITVVVLGVSICASAASFNWSVANDWFSPDGNNDLEGTAYFFDAGTHSMATIADGLANSGLAALSGNLGSKALEYGGLSDFAGTGFNYDGTAPTSITGFLIVVSEDEKNYWTVGETTVTVTDAIKGGKQAVFNFGTIDNASWTGAVGNAPEPTSGLLVLLGMAGLALRRRRA